MVPEGHDSTDYVMGLPGDTAGVCCQAQTYRSLLLGEQLETQNSASGVCISDYPRAARSLAF